VEGLLLHQALKALPPTPIETRGWAFPDEGSAVLRFAGGKDLVLAYRPPTPYLKVSEGAPGGPPLTPVQRFLAARVGGVLQSVEQQKLDRVVILTFSGGGGFVKNPPVRVILEATGRNANLIVTDLEGRILALDRPVGPGQNRYRQLQVGGRYRPPPPYEKLDPRTLSESDLKVLVGQPAKALLRYVDGLGPGLTGRVLELAGLEPETRITAEHLPALRRALKRLATDPEAAKPLLAKLGEEPSERLEALRRPLIEALEKERQALLRRRQDHLENIARAAEAERYRRLGELVLAYAHEIPKGVGEVELFDYHENRPVRVPLDPQKRPPENAEAFFKKARKLQEGAAKARDLLATTEANLRRVETEIAALKTAGPKELKARLKRAREEGPGVGIRRTAPGGFAVWVGRNAKENVALLRLARSEDLWFHAQGAPGSHVILRTRGKNPPLEALLFAARLAAYHSRLHGEKNAPVDYTKKKYVRPVKKAPPGTVTYTQAKTLFVDATPPE